MPRPTKRAKTKAPRAQANAAPADHPGVDTLAAPTAVEEAVPVVPRHAEQEEIPQPSPEPPPMGEMPSEDMAPHRRGDDDDGEPRGRRRQDGEPSGSDKDRIANSLNIAKLQAMSMGELNQMARQLGV